jgi:hypothetical protein
MWEGNLDEWCTVCVALLTLQERPKVAPVLGLRSYLLKQLLEISTRRQCPFLTT